MEGAHINNTEGTGVDSGDQGIMLGCAHEEMEEAMHLTRPTATRLVESMRWRLGVFTLVLETRTPVHRHTVGRNARMEIFGDCAKTARGSRVMSFTFEQESDRRAQGHGL